MKLTPLEIGLLTLLLSPITNIIIVSIMERKHKKKEQNDETHQP